MFSLFATKPQDTAPATSPAPAGADPVAREDDLPTVAPAVDIADTGTEVVLYADLPGVAQDGLELTVDRDRLTLRATPALLEPGQLTPIHREHRRRRFLRTFLIGDTLDASRIQARLADGVLKLTLPRRDAVAPRRISIQSA